MELFSLLSDECQAQTQSSIDSFVSRLTRRYPRGIAVDVTRPARSIPRLLGITRGDCALRVAVLKLGGVRVQILRLWLAKFYNRKSKA
ncbi:MAG: hypothetical protein DMF22_07835 [Verrucomicrobia bacterium]|nr:MAG: hypothetical protein DMF22_07835 [Verrucomicrobiota bacterium]